MPNFVIHVLLFITNVVMLIKEVFYRYIYVYIETFTVSNNLLQHYND